MSGITSKPDPFLFVLNILSTDKSAFNNADAPLTFGIGVTHRLSSVSGLYAFKFLPSEITTIPLKGTIIKSVTFPSKSSVSSAALCEKTEHDKNNKTTRVSLFIFIILWEITE